MIAASQLRADGMVLRTDHQISGSGSTNGGRDLPRTQGSAIAPHIDRFSVPLCSLSDCSEYGGVECDVMPGEIMTNVSVCRPQVQSMAYTIAKLKTRLKTARTQNRPTAGPVEE